MNMNWLHVSLIFTISNLHNVSERSHLTPGNTTSPLGIYIHSRSLPERREIYIFHIIRIDLDLGAADEQTSPSEGKIHVLSWKQWLRGAASSLALSSENTSSSSAPAVNAAQILPRAADSEWFCKIKSVKQKRGVVL